MHLTADTLEVFENSGEIFCLSFFPIQDPPFSWTQHKSDNPWDIPQFPVISASADSRKKK